MVLTYLMLAVALCLSAVAAFYSIIGLTAIFAAAVWPIVIMGTILEAAKLVVTVWLHEYWHQVKLSMKLYLVPAVFILMVITSMGIFGFLSKAHLDQAVPTGDVAAQVSLLDEKIRTQRDNIDAARKALAQMDAAVDQTMARSSDEKGADKAAALRRSQARERGNLQSDIARAQAEIAKLNEQRAPVASQLRKVEAEVGPIKYIAALIYGDNPDANLLEKAVRWVIIILVTVFDPLAIMMLLAFTESLKWEHVNRKQRDKSKQGQIDITSQPSSGTTMVMHTAESLESGAADKHLSDDPTLDTRHADQKQDQPVQPGPPHVNQPRLDDRPAKAHIEFIDDFHEPDWLESSAIQNIKVASKLDDDEEEHDEHTVIRQCQRLWKQDNPGQTLKEQRRLVAAGVLDHEPWLDLLDDPRIHRDIMLGTQLPVSGIRGDMFVLLSAVPTTLFKYNGEKWIAVDKSSTDQYAFNDAYIDHLIQLVGSGSYDPELLTDAERSQISLKLRKEV